MVNGGDQKPGLSLWTRTHGPRRGRRPGGSQGALRPAWPRSAYGYVVASLAVSALVGAWLLGVAGCTAPGSGYGRLEKNPEFITPNMRLSQGEITRLTQNAHYYRLMGQPELGLREMELAHRQNPTDLQIINLLAQNYEDLGKFEAARQLYQKALDQQGSQPAIANNLCFSYYREGRWQEAETCFRHTLDHDPQNVAARNNLGLLYCRLGRQDEARRLWQEAEGSAAADARLSQALAALGMPDRAVYARKPEAGPPLASATQAPTAPTPSPPDPAPVPAKAHPPASPVTPPEPVKPLAAKPPAPRPVAASPGPQVRKATASPKQVPVACTSSPAPQKPLTATELTNVNLEVRNGTWTKDLARKTRTLLRQEGFTVAKIGNHLDFGAATTMIYYRPGAERSARAVAGAIFPGAGLEPSPNLKKGLDIKILLGADLLDNPQFMARLAGAAPPAAAASGPPPAVAQPVAAKTEAERPAAGPPKPPPAATAPAGPEPQPLPVKPKAVATPPLPVATRLSLSAAELADTAIEVRNGTWTKDLAHKIRTLLRQEGFTVDCIGNHLDFGAAETIIYYRPEAEKVARAMGQKLFPGARLEPSTRLKNGMDIKILLGADLLQRPQLMARLVGEGA
jgi:hypothetical protein